MVDEREEAYRDLARQKDHLECWLAVRNWPKDPEISMALDRILVMLERKDANEHVCRLRD